MTKKRADASPSGTRRRPRRRGRTVVRALERSRAGRGTDRWCRGSEQQRSRRPGTKGISDGRTPRGAGRAARLVVLGYRTGPHGQAVLHHGADLADRVRAALHVVHVVDLGDDPSDPDSPDMEQQAQETLAAEQHDVETALADLHDSWTYDAARGDPVALLQQVADNYDALMFIVGGPREGAASVVSRLLGSRPSVSHDPVAR